MEDIRPLRRLSDRTVATGRELARLLDDRLDERVRPGLVAFVPTFLGVPSERVTGVRLATGSLHHRLVAREVARDLLRYTPPMVGIDRGAEPMWSSYDFGERRSVPTSLAAGFAAGTVAEVPLVVASDVDTSSYEDRHDIAVYARIEDVARAAAYVRDLQQRAWGADNPYRGRALRVTTEFGDLEVEPVTLPRETRDDLILPAPVWDAIDANTHRLFERWPIMDELGLGLDRGILVAGPPGTGKTALCRLLACELEGRVTTLLPDTETVGHHLGELYDTAELLAPTLVVLEDVDLLAGRRGGAIGASLHEFLVTLDGAYRTDAGIVTLATTNDPSVLDEAALRAARFDAVVELPLPDEHARAAILRRYLGRLTPQVDCGLVARSVGRLSGAHLRELVRAAVIADAEDLTTASLLRAARQRDARPAADGRYL